MLEMRRTHPIGTIIQGRYVVLALLGKGGFGAVYLVKDQRNKRDLFALKEVVNPSKVERSQFTFEAELLSRLDHPALPHVYCVFNDDKQDRLYMLMNYIEGTNLLLLQHEQYERRFSLRYVLTIMAPIMDAVTYLHRQHPPIVHRDIKPSNIIVPKAKGVSVLVDFGIAKEYNTDLTTNAIRHCTPGYGAPEQYTGGTDPRTDIYALGATLYTLLTGTIPADALHRSMRLGSKEPDPLVPVNSFTPTIPETVNEAIQCAMSINRNDRFSTVEQFWQTLNADSLMQQDSEPQLEARTQQTPILVTNPAAQQTPDSNGALSPQPQAPYVSVGVKKPAVVSSREQFQIHRIKKLAKSLPILLLTLFVIVLSSVSIGIGIRSFASSHLSPSAIPTSLPRHSNAPPLRPPHPSPTSTGSLNVVELFHGTIHDIPDKMTTEMSLTDIHQQQGNISGYFTGLGRNGPLKGTITPARRIQFIVTRNAGQTILTFDGVMQADGTLIGTYCDLNRAGQCTSYGFWKVSPTQTG